MVLITKRMMVTSRAQLARSHHRFLTPRLGLRADSAWFRADGPQKEGPMWMMQQPVLPASPRAVTNVPKAVRNSSALAALVTIEKRNVLIRDDTHLRHHGQ